MKPEAIPTQKPFCPKHLDILLAHGWFRMGRYMYTVNHIGIEDEIRVFWLCYQLSEILLPRSVMEIRKRGNRFDFHYSDLELTKELTDLYHSYRKSIDLDAADSLDQVLYRQEAGKGLPQNFRSKVVEMRDKGRLVAAGIFDHGESAVMGIVNFFLPEYRKFSPGKLMMLKKIDWARENGFQYFYPGYIGAGDSRFDYKLFAGEAGAYLYDPLGYRWYPYEAGLAEFLAKNQVVAIRELNEPQWLDPVHAEKALKHLL